MSLQTYRRLLIATALLLYTLVVVSGLVRITGSELGCPGWPLCGGQLIPPARFDAWLELAHRLLTLGTGVVLCITAQAAWRLRAEAGETMVWQPPLLAAALLVVQTLASVLVLWLGYAWLFVVIAVGLQTLMLACLLISVVALTIPDHSHKKPSNDRERIEARQYRLLVSVVALASWVLVLIGATVAGTASGMACIGFPDCNGELIPTSGGLSVIIHMTHRLTAYAVILLMLWVFITTAVKRWRDYVLIQWVLLSGALLMTQATLGGANSLLAMPIFLRALHLATATAYWGSIVVLTLLTLRRPVLSGLDSSGRILQGETDYAQKSSIPVPGNE